MPLKVPHWGPNKGRLVRHDGTVVPEVDTSATPPPVVVPEVLTTKDDVDHKRGSVSLMEGQLVEAGWAPARARQIAVQAARRSDGSEVPYPERAAERRIEGDR